MKKLAEIREGSNQEVDPVVYAVNGIMLEHYKAVLEYPKMHSLHEGFAILLEEVDELWAEIKKKPSQQDLKAIRNEATQVAAMAMRMMIDLL